MTVVDRVRDFLLARPGQTVCDGCISNKLDLSISNHANHKTRKLAASRHFHRERGTCSICAATRLVIQNV